MGWKRDVGGGRGGREIVGGLGRNRDGGEGEVLGLEGGGGGAMRFHAIQLSRANFVIGSLLIEDNGTAF